MIVSRLILDNWRNFPTVDVPLRERTFLVGPNASGKSNLLDVFRFLRDLATPQGGGLQHAVRSRGGLAHLYCLSARRAGEVYLEVHLAAAEGRAPLWRYGLGFARSRRRGTEAEVTRERVWKGRSLILSRPDVEDRADPTRLTQTGLEQVHANRTFRPVAAFLGRIARLHLLPQLLRHREALRGVALEEDLLDLGLLERIAATPTQTRRSRLNKIQKALRATVPQFDALHFVRDKGTGQPHLEARQKHWRGRTLRQREDQFSDGTLRLIALLWGLLEGDAPLLLEEPELSLNAAVAAELPALIWRMQQARRRQVLASTHSPDLLGDPGIDGGEVLWLQPGSEGTQVLVPDTVHEIRVQLQQGLTIADTVLSSTRPAGLDALGRVE